jgi:hypothetical protein
VKAAERVGGDFYKKVINNHFLRDKDHLFMYGIVQKLPILAEMLALTSKLGEKTDV